MDWRTAARIVIAVTMIAIGIMGLVGGSFGPIWGVVPKTLPDRQLLAYLCTFVSFVCGAGLLVKRTAAPAAFLLLIYLVIWTALFKVPFILKAPLEEGSYQTCGENAVLIAAAWLLLLETARSGPAILRVVGGQVGRRIALVLYGLALIAFGLSHFFYLQLTAPLIPAWIAAHTFWAYFTGCVYLATGIAIVIGFGARLAAVLVAVQITLITLIVWGAIDLSGPLTAENWEETVISWALTVSAWVVAAFFAGQPWFQRSGSREPAGGAAVAA
jgi:uncharacterized membrane protein